MSTTKAQHVKSFFSASSKLFSVMGSIAISGRPSIKSGKHSQPDLHNLYKDFYNIGKDFNTSISKLNEK